jgi:Fe-S cluster biogenesis protein NfuA
MESGAAEETSLRRMAGRVETLLSGFDAVSTPRAARELGDELARTFVTLYGSGLERVLEIVHATAGERSDAIFAQLCEDPFVESLLCLHGLHPYSVEDRVELALDSVRPYLKSHAGDVGIASVDGGVVTLRLHGTCDGCSSSATTLKLAVERAILERVPEIHTVVAENVTPPADENPLCPVASEDAHGRLTISLGV